MHLVPVLQDLVLFLLVGIVRWGQATLHLTPMYKQVGGEFESAGLLAQEVVVFFFLISKHAC